ncbi:unnamed protein product [Soboliphyme baturini]|uniref:Uncharacterized protein n=1 Tax=Soboliphyme baturini TaxID=241478 RepID=A0A183IA90_9BILA|nr:unnamed protein product [Soboliphyme baturini]
MFSPLSSPRGDSAGATWTRFRTSTFRHDYAEFAVVNAPCFSTTDQQRKLSSRLIKTNG